MEFRILIAVAIFIPVWMIAAVLHLNSGGMELQKRQADLAQQWVPYDSEAASAQNMAPPVAAISKTPSPPSPACQVEEKSAIATSSLLDSDRPPEGLALADPTNYGDRFRQDISGRPVNNQWLIVLHETVNSAASAVRFFQTPHPRDEDQASYHTLIARDGTIIYVVPPEKRAYGAGNSVFVGPNGPEAVKTHGALPASVNNFAYHISLESPADGANNQSAHSGYTEAQYQSLAWLVARTQIPDSRITTHAQVDRSGERHDPRSFEAERLLALLQTLRARGTGEACSQSG